MHVIVAIAFVLILASLFSGLYFVMKDRGRSNRAVNALSLRIGFSILLFIFILLSYKLGWLHPNGIALTQR